MLTYLEPQGPPFFGIITEPSRFAKLRTCRSPAAMPSPRSAAFGGQFAVRCVAPVVDPETLLRANTFIRRVQNLVEHLDERDQERPEQECVGERWAKIEERCGWHGCGDMWRS